MARVTGYQDWVAHNVAVIKEGITLFVRQKKTEIEAALKTVAFEFIAKIETGEIPIPVYTGNMSDATGLGLYVDGRMSAFLPFPIATRKQTTGPGMGGRRAIDGHQFLAASIREGQTTFSTGIWLVLYSAVPYAMKIDMEGSKWGRGQDYFKTAKEVLTSMLKGSLNTVQGKNMYTFKI